MAVLSAAAAFEPPSELFDPYLSEVTDGAPVGSGPVQEQILQPGDDYPPPPRRGRREYLWHPIDPNISELWWRRMLFRRHVWSRRVPGTIGIEYVSAPDGLLIGIWVPSDVSVEAVSRAASQAWPDAIVVDREAGMPWQTSHGQPVSAAWLTPRRHELLPIASLPKIKPGPDSGQNDPLRALFDGLSQYNQRGTAMAQILVRTASAARLNRAWKALAKRSRGRGERPWCQRDVLICHRHI
jgi:hypothetical protein